MKNARFLLHLLLITALSAALYPFPLLLAIWSGSAGWTAPVMTAALVLCVWLGTLYILLLRRQYARHPRWVNGGVWALTLLLCVLGIITLIRHKDAVAFLCVAYGICIMADSLFKIRTALDAKAFGIRQWWVTLVLAGLTALIGLLITLCPVAAARAVTVLLGISFVSEGLLSLGVAISMVKIVDNQQPDVIVSDDYEEWEES
mgnify:CR=1 FL=1